MTLAAFSRFVPELRLEGGAPMALEPYQRAILRDHFGPASELVVVIPKKNGKTTLLAALALYHAATVTDAYVPVVAAARDQAGVMYRQAEKIIRRSGEKSTKRKDVYSLAGVTWEVRPGYKEIRCVESGGLIQVLAADATYNDGAIPTLALVDELHRHRTAEMYGVLADGLGPRRGKMITISTAGADEAGVLGLIRAKAHALADTKITGRHRRAAEGAFVYHEWALDPDADDPDNLRHVKRANPASMQSLAELARRRDSPTMTRGRWLRFACGIWTASDDPPIDATDWDRLRVDIGQIEVGEAVDLAPSVGHNAAIGIAAPRGEGRVAIAVQMLDAEPGTSILARTEDAIADLCTRYDVRAVHHPLGGFARSADLLAARGVPVVEAPHSLPRLVAATGTFQRLVKAGLLMHDGDVTLRAHVLRATMKVNESGERFMVADGSRGIIAAMMAAHAATAESPTPLIVLPGAGVG